MKHLIRVSVWLAAASCAIEIYVVLDTARDWQPHTTIAACVVGLWLFGAFLWWLVGALQNGGAIAMPSVRRMVMPQPQRTYNKRTRRVI